MMYRGWRGPRRKLSAEETEANRAAKAKRDADAMSCQICERKILANTGLIAHHGYQRPGHGWQTASCFGARYRPYEVACDALPKAIDGLGRWIDNIKAALVKWVAEPPRGIEVKPRSEYDKTRPHSVLRPVGFDVSLGPHGSRARTYPRDEYERLYWVEHADMESQIRHATIDLERLKKRLADWRPA